MPHNPGELQDEIATKVAEEACPCSQAEQEKLEKASKQAAKTLAKDPYADVK